MRRCRRRGRQCFMPRKEGGGEEGGEKGERRDVVTMMSSRVVPSSLTLNSALSAPSSPYSETHNIQHKCLTAT